jgi:hypothetical protein
MFSGLHQPDMVQIEVKMKRQVFLAATQVVLINAENGLAAHWSVRQLRHFLATNGIFFVG